MIETCLALSGALTLTGCATGASNPTAEPAEPVETVGPSEAPGSAVITTDEVTCAASGDVQTIIQNADLGFLVGRMSAKEQQG